MNAWDDLQAHIRAHVPPADTVERLLADIDASTARLQAAVERCEALPPREMTTLEAFAFWRWLRKRSQ